jgi:glycosyltransferase involved in cell wall biosynthesis
LVGGATSPQYLEEIKSRIQELSLEDQVLLAGKVPDSTLLALYRVADVFVCMSEHEGFGMPLIEAMCFDVPVIAHAASGIPDTMGEGGLLFDDTSPRAVAALIHLLINEPGLRRRVIAGQRRNLQRFETHHLRQELSGFIQQLGIEIPEPPVPIESTTRLPYWQIEGPFDSSYSLAIVNRELARALTKRNNNKEIGLRSLEGGRNVDPRPGFLTANPDCALLVERALAPNAVPDVALRFCYPPHLDDMIANVRVMHSYGWEETGFPVEYVGAFNRKLDLITVLSEFVKKVLEDSGIRIPIAVTGGGVDHLLRSTPKMPSEKIRKFSFLHISSCFPRKGVDAMLVAYGKAFRQSDEVTLVIKTFPNPHNDVEAQLRKQQTLDAGYPDVLVVNQDCTDEELVGWYAACDALVAPSHGEGLGLPLAEAMLFNLPVITTGWSGQRDFCDDTSAWLCDFQFEKSSSHLGKVHSVWARPDIQHLATLMREVYELPPEKRAKRTDLAHKRILDHFTWDCVAQRTEQAIHALSALPVIRNEPKIGWISTWNKRCGIATYSGFLTVAIPADRLTIFADRSAELTQSDADNVVRNWNMHCDEKLNDVFNDVIARAIDVLVVQYNFGFFSVANLAQLIERLQRAGVAVHVFFHATADLVRDGKTISLASIKDTLAKATRLYVHAVSDLNRFKSYGLVNNVVFFPHGIASVPYQPIRQAGQNNLPEGATVIAAYGFLLPHKGLQQLIEAFSHLAKGSANLQLLLVNALYPAPESNHEHQACVTLINELNLNSRVTLITDFLSDAHCIATLQQADLIVFPYQQTQESASGAVNVGLASGKPVAVTPLTIFDDVADAVHRLPGTDPQSIADGIYNLLKNPQALEAQTQQTQQWAASRQWPVLSVRLLNLIDSLANPLF